MGFGHVYTVGLGAVLASIAAIRGIHLGRLFREAAGEGWGQEDLLQAMDREARENQANERRRPPLGRQLLFYVVGLGAVLLYWLGPKQWGLESADTLPGLVIELLGLAAPVALGRWLGTQLEAPREGRPGLLSRFFIRFKSGMFFRLLGRRERSAPLTRRLRTSQLRWSCWSRRRRSSVRYPRRSGSGSARPRICYESWRRRPVSTVPVSPTWTGLWLTWGERAQRRAGKQERR